MEDSLKWIVPAGKRLSHLDSVFSIFSFEVWMCLLLLTIVMPVLVYLAARQRSEEIRYLKTFQNCFTICFMSSLTQPAYPHPKTALLRYILALWWFLSLIVLTAYQSHLVTYLNFYQYSRPLNSIEEIVDCKMKFGFNEELHDLFLNFTNKYEEYIFKNYKECELGYVCLNKTAFNRDFATITSTRFASRGSYYLSPDDGFLLHFLEPKVRNILVSIAFTKGHPIFEDFNRLLMIIRSSGFVEYSYDILIHVNNLNAFTSSVLTLNSNDLSLDELSGAFIVLGIGLFIATISFLIEVFCQGRFLV